MPGYRNTAVTSKTSEVIPPLLHTGKALSAFTHLRIFGHQVSRKMRIYCSKCRGERQRDWKAGNHDLQRQTESVGGCSARRRAKGGMRVLSYVPGCSEEEWNSLFSMSIADRTQHYAVNCRKRSLAPASGNKHSNSRNSWDLERMFHTSTSGEIKEIRQTSTLGKAEPALRHNDGVDTFSRPVFCGFLFTNWLSNIMSFIRRLFYSSLYEWVGYWCLDSLPPFFSGSFVDFTLQTTRVQAFLAVWLLRVCPLFGGWHSWSWWPQSTGNTQDM